jgi:uncharacterized protein YegL
MSVRPLAASTLTKALAPLPVPPTASPDPRVPCDIVVDKSSMAGDKIAQFNAALAAFDEFVKSDKLTSANAELAVVSVADTVEVEVPFTPAASFKPPVLEAYGNTPLGGGCLTALQLLDERLKLYREHERDAHTPWLMLLTDGGENVDHGQFAAAGHLIRRLEGAGRLRFFAVGVDGADMPQLQTLTAGRPFKLRGLDWKACFAWLYRSLRTVSRARPGQDVEPQNPCAAGWAEYGRRPCGTGRSDPANSSPPTARSGRAARGRRTGSPAARTSWPRCTTARRRSWGPSSTR